MAKRSVQAVSAAGPPSFVPCLFGTSAHRSCHLLSPISPVLRSAPSRRGRLSPHIATMSKSPDAPAKPKPAEKAGQRPHAQFQGLAPGAEAAGGLSRRSAQPGDQSRQGGARRRGRLHRHAAGRLRDGGSRPATTQPKRKIGKKANSAFDGIEGETAASRDRAIAAERCSRPAAPSSTPASPGRRIGRRAPTNRKAASASACSRSSSRPATSRPRSPSWWTACARQERDQVLLGVTGSGKTFTMAQGDRGDAAPGADPRAQQDAGGAALRRVQELLPRQRGRVFRLLLRLLPARGLCAALGHLHREGILDQRADRPHAPLGDARAAGARRRHHRRLGLLHLRHRLGRDLYGDDVRA